MHFYRSAQICSIKKFADMHFYRFLTKSFKKKWQWSAFTDHCRTLLNNCAEIMKLQTCADLRPKKFPDVTPTRLPLLPIAPTRLSSLLFAPLRLPSLLFISHHSSLSPITSFHLPSCPISPFCSYHFPLLFLLPFAFYIHYSIVISFLLAFFFLIIIIYLSFYLLLLFLLFVSLH